HGLNRTALSMIPIAIAARRRGYRVINWHYPSKRRSVAQHADALAREVAPRLAGSPRVHFVTHSLGGIIVRQFLATHPLPNVGRVVMLAPPNRGSEVADVLQPLLGRVMKPLIELGTSSITAIPTPDFELGIIAGSRSHIPLFSRWMNDVANDGVVAVERTKLDTMRDFIVLERTHTFLPWAPDAIAHAFAFLERGRFALA
ncbi:MAG TPA: alpha/beta fold hydrolase, partial [Vicinamibacterales bacterium]|nr:alpha/beta fold hydrolase [Vicinamibacterales bacterium]